MYNMYKQKNDGNEIDTTTKIEKMKGVIVRGTR